MRVYDISPDEAGKSMQKRVVANEIRARSNQGFTLVETLLSLVILVILTGIIAMGVPVAFKTYTTAVNGSNAQILLSTAATSLRDVLGTAQGYDSSASTGATIRIRTGEGYFADISKNGTKESSRITITKRLGETGSTAEQTVNLISDAATTRELGITYDTIDYNDAEGVFNVVGLRVVDKDGNALASVGINGVSGDAAKTLKIKASMMEKS